MAQVTHCVAEVVAMKHTMRCAVVVKQAQVVP
jgi:hypothetical protein